MKRRILHKFKAIASYADKIRFPSKLERDCYNRLKQLQSQGKILFFIRQPSFDLPGGTKHSIDFEVFLPDEVKFLESKGRDLPLGKLKRLQVEELFGITVEVIKTPSDIDDALFTQKSA